MIIQSSDKKKNCLAAHSVTLAPQAVLVLDLVPILKNQSDWMHLHKVIVYKANLLITAQMQNLGLKMSLVVNGTRILIYMALGDLDVLEKNQKDLQHNAKAIVTVARDIKKRGK